MSKFAFLQFGPVMSWVAESWKAAVYLPGSSFCRSFFSTSAFFLGFLDAFLDALGAFDALGAALRFFLFGGGEGGLGGALRFLGSIDVTDFFAVADLVCINDVAIGNFYDCKP